MDQLQRMQLFTRIVEQGSFSRVALETGLTQPTISKSVAALEKRLGTRLLNRSTREVRPTEIGNRYYLECRKILEAVAHLEGSVSELQAGPSGVLRVSVPISFGRLYAIPRVVTFLEGNPNLRIELSMTSHRVDLIREGFDLAIQTGQLGDSSLIARKIGRNHRVMVATPRYLRLRGRPEKPADLAGHNCILAGEPWQLQGPGKVERLEISGNLRVNHAEGVREAVLLNLGIGVLPIWAVHREIESGVLDIVLPTYNPTSKDIYAVYPYTRSPASKVKSFIAFLENDLKRIGYLSARRVAARRPVQRPP